MSEGLAIRRATLEDVDAVEAVRASVALDRSRLDDPTYAAEAGKSGFLLQRFIDPEHVGRGLYLVAELDGDIVGYAAMAEEPEISPDDGVDWEATEMAQWYWRRPHRGLGVIAVNPSARKRGVAIQLLRAVEDAAVRGSAEHLFSFVVCAPVRNQASMAWHSANGFEVAGVLRPTTYAGIANHQSTIFVKRPV